MLRFDWNSLRPGDAVSVHDDESGGGLTEGVVSLVQTASQNNEVAIRLAGDESIPRIVRPRRLAVHRSPRDRTEPCWRCDLAEARAR